MAFNISTTVCDEVCREAIRSDNEEPAEPQWSRHGGATQG
jgi:hypothetical protein